MPVLLIGPTDACATDRIGPTGACVTDRAHRCLCY